MLPSHHRKTIKTSHFFRSLSLRSTFDAVVTLENVDFIYRSAYSVVVVVVASSCTMNRKIKLSSTTKRNGTHRRASSVRFDLGRLKHQRRRLLVTNVSSQQCIIFRKNYYYFHAAIVSITSVWRIKIQWREWEMATTSNIDIKINKNKNDKNDRIAHHQCLAIAREESIKP